MSYEPCIICGAAGDHDEGCPVGETARFDALIRRERNRIIWSVLVIAALLTLLIGFAIKAHAEPEPVKVAKLYVGYNNVFNNDGANWCADFVVRVFGEDLPVKPARSARLLYNAMVVAGLDTEDPQPGDLIFFWRESIRSWKGHVGIVETRKGNKITTIEGNVGGRVVRRTYTLGDIPRLLGFGRTGSAEND